MKLGDTCAPRPTLSSLAGLLWDRCFSEGHCAATLPCASGSLWCTPADSCVCRFLLSRAHSAHPATPTGPVLPGTTVVLLRPLGSCPAWLHCGPLPVSHGLAPRWSRDLPLITKSILPYNNYVRSSHRLLSPYPPPRKKKKIFCLL